VPAIASDVVTAHAGHTAVVGGAVLLGAVLVLLTTRRRLVRELDPGADTSPSPLVVALASLVAAAVHVSVVGEHAEESALYAAFFVVLTVAQVVYAVAVVARPDRLLLLAGAVGNAMTVALWVVTRTAGIPLGPEAGEVESVGVLDAVATAAEVVAVVAALWVWRQAAISRTALGSRDSSSLDMHATSMARASATTDGSR
jgi:hypothetical protein